MSHRSITHERAAAAVFFTLSCWVLGACFPANRSVGGGPSPPVTSPRPDSFQGHVDRRLAELDHHVRRDVAAGRLGPRVIDELGRREEQVRAQLAAATSDGVIDESERRQIEHAIRSASRVTDPGSYEAPGFGRHYMLSRWNWEHGYW